MIVRKLQQMRFLNPNNRRMMDSLNHDFENNKLQIRYTMLLTLYGNHKKISSALFADFIQLFHHWFGESNYRKLTISY